MLRPENETAVLNESLWYIMSINRCHDGASLTSATAFSLNPHDSSPVTVSGTLTYMIYLSITRRVHVSLLRVLPKAESLFLVPVPIP